VAIPNERTQQHPPDDTGRAETLQRVLNKQIVDTTSQRGQRLARIVRAVAAGEPTLINQHITPFEPGCIPVEECQRFLAKVPTAQTYDGEVAPLLAEIATSDENVTARLAKYGRDVEVLRRFLFETLPPAPMPAPPEQKAVAGPSEWEAAVDEIFDVMTAAYAKRLREAQGAGVKLTDEEVADYRFCRVATLVGSGGQLTHGGDVLTREQWHQFIESRQANENKGLTPRDDAMVKIQFGNIAKSLLYDEARNRLDDFIKGLPPKPAE